jgi:hypothetical protein
LSDLRRHVAAPIEQPVAVASDSVHGPKIDLGHLYT